MGRYLTKRIAPLLLAAVVSGCSLSPEPLENQTQLKANKARLDEFFRHQAKITHPITLSEAIARALKFNLDHHLRKMQSALANQQFRLAALEMLPSVDAAYDYNYRRNQYVSLDANLNPNTTSVTPRITRDTKVHINWDLLDLGMNYYRARQKADQYLIAKEQQRKVQQTLIAQVVSTYIKAYSAQALRTKVDNIQKAVKTALARSQKSVDIRAASMIIQVDYQQMLIKSLRQLNKLYMQLAQAHQELAQMINADPRLHLTLKKPPVSFQSFKPIKTPLEDLDTVALVYRPELREMHYRVRIAKQGIKVAVLDMLPNLGLKLGRNHTDSKYVLHDSWIDANLKSAWNVLDLLSGPQKIRSAKMQQRTEQMREMALTLGTLTQVRLALSEYEMARRDYTFSLQESKNAARIFDQTQRLSKARLSNEQAVIRRSLGAINAEIDRDLTLAKTYDAQTKLRTSVGLDYLAQVDTPDQTIQSLTKEVSRVIKRHPPSHFQQEVVMAYKNLVKSKV